MADTAIRLAGPVGLGTSAATLYTVPGATTTILRSAHVANTTGADRTFRLSIGTDGAGKRLFYDQLVPVGDSFDWSGFVVLTAGEVVQGLADAVGCDITLSGV